MGDLAGEGQGTLIVIGQVLGEWNPVYPAQSQNDKTGYPEENVRVITRFIFKRVWHTYIKYGLVIEKSNEDQDMNRLKSFVPSISPPGPDE